jgi:hypothetical protein
MPVIRHDSAVLPGKMRISRSHALPMRDGRETLTEPMQPPRPGTCYDRYMAVALAGQVGAALATSHPVSQD